MGNFQKAIIVFLFINLAAVSWIHIVFSTEFSYIFHVSLFFLVCVCLDIISRRDRFLLRPISYFFVFLASSSAINISFLFHLLIFKNKNIFISGDFEVYLYLFVDVILYLLISFLSYRKIIERNIDIAFLTRAKFISKKKDEFYFHPKVYAFLKGKKIEAKNAQQSLSKSTVYLFSIMFLFGSISHYLSNTFIETFMIFSGYFFLILFSWLGINPYFFVILSEQYEKETGRPIYGI